MYGCVYTLVCAKVEVIYVYVHGLAYVCVYAHCISMSIRLCFCKCTGVFLFSVYVYAQVYAYVADAFVPANAYAKAFVYEIVNVDLCANDNGFVYT